MQWKRNIAATSMFFKYLKHSLFLKFLFKTPKLLFSLLNLIINQVFRLDQNSMYQGRS